MPASRPKELKGRAQARTRYHEVLAGPWGDHMPIVARDLMDDWRFDGTIRTATSIGELTTIRKRLARDPASFSTAEAEAEIVPASD